MEEGKERWRQSHTEIEREGGRGRERGVSMAQRGRKGGREIGRERDTERERE